MSTPRPARPPRTGWRAAAALALAPALATLGALLTSGGAMALLLTAAGTTTPTPRPPAAMSVAARPASPSPATRHLDAIVVRPAWDVAPVATVRPVRPATTLCRASRPRTATANNAA